jgi:hypothetical protein
MRKALSRRSNRVSQAELPSFVILSKIYQSSNDPEGRYDVFIEHCGMERSEMERSGVEGSPCQLEHSGRSFDSQALVNDFVIELRDCSLRITPVGTPHSPPPFFILNS